ncbi:hypothetical protein KC799_00645, partial [candidate division KSB1 bacterium]|nr:hypothetical protein [candidate division KSB1 bacterium]
MWPVGSFYFSSKKIPDKKRRNAVNFDAEMCNYYTFLKNTLHNFHPSPCLKIGALSRLGSNKRVLKSGI